jgi:CPA2 family monovalent cation:H+ antiporter-2
MGHLPHLITDLALILAAAGIVAIICRRFKQPVVLGYILAGFLVGPHFSFLPTVLERENISIWSEIGVIVLLFSLGLEFSFKKLIKVGAPASIGALSEIIFMSLIGFGTGKLMGWNTMDSLFLGGLLSVSSTTIIIRAFEELNIKAQRYATIVFGILIVEDLAAIGLMVLLSTLAVSQQFAGPDMLFSILKLLFFLIIWFVGGIFFIPTFLKKVKKWMNEETLLLLSLSLCFIMVVLANKAGFSPALGAFLMGSILAETTSAEKIEHLIIPIKDLFGGIFFVSVGMLIDPNIIVEYAVPILIITVVTIVGKLLSTGLGTLIAGQSLQTSVQVGLSLSQIGEFSFIIAGLGMTLGVTSHFLYPITVAVSAVTTLTTPYSIKYSKHVYKFIEKFLPKKMVNFFQNEHAEGKKVASISDWQSVLKSALTNIAVLSAIILTFILAASQFVLPYVMENLDGNVWAKYATVTVTLLFILPFMWALAVRIKHSEEYARILASPKYKPLVYALFIVRLILVAAFIGLLFHNFFNIWVGLIATCVIIFTLFSFSKKIQAFYDKIESRFMSNFNQREIAAAKKNRSELAPWDAHIVPIKIGPDSPSAGKTLKDLAWRETLGINVVMIKRGEHHIPIPTWNDQVFPGDEILILGTDAQMKRLQAIIRPAKHTKEGVEEHHDVMMREFVIQEESQLIGKNIRESKIKEIIKGLVVGIERNGHRILNPESDFVFQPNDIVYIVGDDKIVPEVIKKINKKTI